MILRTSKTFRWLALPAVLASVAVAGCGDDEETAQEGTAEDTATQEDTAAQEGAQQIEIEATEEASGARPLEVPESAEAGLAEITLTNSGQAPHDAQLIRVEGDRGGEEVLKALVGSFRGDGLPPWFLAGGGVGTTPPGESRSVTQVLEPGTYYAVDTETQGQPAVPPAIEVTGEAGEEELSQADATITASEYAFETQGLAADGGEITFENVGEQPHHVIAAPLNEGATIEDVERFAQDESGPPPIDFERQTSSAVIEGGDTQVIDMQLESGNYALICFITDREGGPPHALQGMIAEAQVE